MKSLKDIGRLLGFVTLDHSSQRLPELHEGPEEQVPGPVSGSRPGQPANSPLEEAERGLRQEIQGVVPAHLQQRAESNRETVVHRETKVDPEPPHLQRRDLGVPYQEGEEEAGAPHQSHHSETAGDNR